MPPSGIFPLSLDAKTKKIIKQIPRGFKSETIRRWIAKGAEDEDFIIPLVKDKKASSDQAITNQLRMLRSG